MATKKNTNKPQEKVDIDKMKDMSEEDDIKQAPKYTLPSVKLNGKEGIFYRTVIEKGQLKLADDGRALLEDLGDEISGTVLKVRKTYFQDDPDSQLYTNEVSSSKNAQVSVFCKTENAKGGFNTTFVFQGNSGEVKQRFPEISMIQVIYFLLEDTNEIVRLKVKGMSLGQLFNYWKEFDPDEHLFEFITLLGSKKDKNKYGTFFVNTFKKGKRIPHLEVVETAMKEVHTNLMAIEEFYRGRQEEPLGEIPIVEEVIDSEEALKESKQKILTEKEDDEDEIDPKKIPF